MDFGVPVHYFNPTDLIALNPLRGLPPGPARQHP
jgi:hypothetical protein